jgi:hypothetical protein
MKYGIQYFLITAQHTDGRPSETFEWNAKKYETAYKRADQHYKRLWGKGNFNLTPKPDTAK